ncbi:MAG: MASE1 domain-containing protein [Candidatus Acidiferrales bacterium]
MTVGQALLSRFKANAGVRLSAKDIPQFALVIAGCFLAGQLGLKITVLHPPVSPIWPPIGVALAAAVLLGYRVWPAVFAAAFLICVSTSTPLRAAFVISLGNTLEVLAATYLVNRFARGIKAFETAQGVVKFVLFACVLAPIISASICVGYLVPAGFMHGPDKGIMWLTWWVGDSIGALLFAPFLILVFGSSHHRLDKRELLELNVLLISLITVCMTVFGPISRFFDQKQLLQPWMCVPFLIWAGFRFCQIEAAGTTLLLFGIAIWGTLHGYGPFVTRNFNVSLMVLAAFVGVTATATLAIAATLSERRRVEEGLLGLQSILQETVQGKTRDLTVTIEALQGEASERIQAEISLRESNGRFLQLAETISDVFWLMDIIEMRLLYISPAYEAVWGRPCASLYADPHSWLDAVHPDDHERALTFFDQETTGSQYDAEYRITRPDGSVRHIWDRGFIVRDDTGRISRIAGLASDITEKKRLEEELQEAQKWKPARN